jgi:Carbohydrate-binding module 48 (Isoamylase N-terminal domain)
MTVRSMPDFGNGFLESHPEMIHCPYQPGRLKISAEACKKRTLAGRRIKYSNDGTFLFPGRKSLSICRRCPIGNKLAFGSAGMPEPRRAKGTPPDPISDPGPPGRQSGGETMRDISQNPPEAGKRRQRKKEPSEAGTKKKDPSGIKRAGARKKVTMPQWKLEFLFSGIEAREVFLCGDFNSWDLHALPLEKNLKGEWKAVVPLAPGRYEFKTLADGAWVENGCCEVRMEGTDFTLSLPTESVFNSFGTRNLVVTVR